MIRILLAVLALFAFAAPAHAASCKAGERKLHGKCVPARTAAAGAAVDPFAVLTPKPVGKTQPEIGQKVRSGETYTGVWIDARKRSGFEGTTTAPVDGATLRTVKVTDPGSYGISFCDASNVLIEQFRITRSAPASVSVPTGIGFGRSGCGEKGSNITIRNGVVSGFGATPVAGKYTNGDGIANEGGYTGFTIANVTSSNNGDGGFDLKSKNTRLDDTIAIGNGRNYRLWGSGTAGTITSENPRGAHVWIAKTATSWHIAKLVARSALSSTVLQFDAKNMGIVVTIDACDLTGLAKGSTLVTGATGNKVTLGSGCVVQ